MPSPRAVIFYSGNMNIYEVQYTQLLAVVYESVTILDNIDISVK
jgi:hypothetical protein